MSLTLPVPHMKGLSCLRYTCEDLQIWTFPTLKPVDGPERHLDPILLVCNYLFIVSVFFLSDCHVEQVVYMLGA